MSSEQYHSLPPNILAASVSNNSNRAILTTLEDRMRASIQLSLIPYETSYYGESLVFDLVHFDSSLEVLQQLLRAGSLIE